MKLVNLFILILPGVMASYLYADLAEPDLAFPRLAFDLLPIGLRGLMLAALAAAILSSLEAMLNAASTLLTMDFVRTLRPQISDRGLVSTGRMATLGFMIIAALWAPVIYRFETLWQYLQSSLSYLTPPVVAVFLGGVFWRRANAVGATWTLSLGVPVGVVCWCCVEVLELLAIQYLYACGLLFLFSCLLLAGISLATAPPPQDQTSDMVWSRNYWVKERARDASLPWWKQYETYALALAAVTLTLVAWWW